MSPWVLRNVGLNGWTVTLWSMTSSKASPTCGNSIEDDLEKKQENWSRWWDFSSWPYVASVGRAVKRTKHRISDHLNDTSTNSTSRAKVVRLEVRRRQKAFTRNVQFQLWRYSYFYSMIWFYSFAWQIKLTMEWTSAKDGCTSSYSFVLYFLHRSEFLSLEYFPNTTLSDANTFHPKKTFVTPYFRYWLSGEVHWSSSKVKE